MDTRGAVDLSVDATWMRAPKTLGDTSRQRMLAAADTQWQLPPDSWLESQLVRLALASIIEARLLHVREQRLLSFDLPKDPAVVTLKQLAALWRSHDGAVGQAFELAVADAVGHGVPEVVEPVRDALTRLGIHEAGPLQMILFGLEKVPVDQRDVAAASLLARIPEGAVLRTGQRGRPLTPTTVADRLTRASWPTTPAPAGADAPTADRAGGYHARNLAKAESHAAVSQLPRADALLVAGRKMVCVSMKVSSYPVFHRSNQYGWRDVPLWITRARPGEGPTQVRTQAGARVPMVVVSLADNRWTQCFERALRVLEEVLLAVDLGRPPVGVSTRLGGSIDQVTRLLVKRAHLPVRTIAEELRDVHPAVGSVMGEQIAAVPAAASLTVVDSPAVVRAWEVEGRAGGVYTGQQHLFFGGTDGH